MIGRPAPGEQLLNYLANAIVLIFVIPFIVAQSSIASAHHLKQYEYLASIFLHRDGFENKKHIIALNVFNSPINLEVAEKETGIFNVPVVPVCAISHDGISKLVEKLLNMSK